MVFWSKCWVTGVSDIWIHNDNSLEKMKITLFWGYLVFYTEIWVSPWVTPYEFDLQIQLWRTQINSIPYSWRKVEKKRICEFFVNFVRIADRWPLCWERRNGHWFPTNTSFFHHQKKNFSQYIHVMTNNMVTFLLILSNHPQFPRKRKLLHSTDLQYEKV